MVGVAAAASMAPLFFLGILSGVMADWLERRWFLFLSALVGAAVSIIMAVLLLAGEPHIWAVITLVAASGCVLAFTLTTRLAYTYDIVGSDNALNGLSLNQIGMQLGAVPGALMSGALIETVGARVAIPGRWGGLSRL